MKVMQLLEEVLELESENVDKVEEYHAAKKALKAFFSKRSATPAESGNSPTK